MLRIIYFTAKWVLIVAFMYALVQDNFYLFETRLIDGSTSEDAIELHLELLSSRGIKYTEVVLAQELHETGWFTSKIYRENRNRFGMKVNSRKYHIGKQHNHAKYRRYIDSIDDYAAWQAMRLRQNPWVTNDSLYLEMLIKVGYAEDPMYKKRILETIRELRRLRRKTSASTD